MRKKIYYLSLFVGSIFFLSSCKNDDFNYPEGQVGSSFITEYANFTMTGPRYLVLKPGETFTEPGVTAEAEGGEIPVVIGGEQVNTTTSGVYTISYSATNKDGFTSSIARTVVVADIKPDAALNDFSGKYARNTNGVIATWTRVAPGVYTVENPGGAPGATLTVVAVNEQGTSIRIPQQLASDGSPTSSSNEIYNATGSPVSFAWTILNPGYGTALRTFIKQ